MTLVIVLLCIAGLVILISACKINAFLSFLIISVVAGIALGLPATQIG